MTRVRHGDALIDDIFAAHQVALIWDSSRPGLVRLAYTAGPRPPTTGSPTPSASTMPTPNTATRKVTAAAQTPEPTDA